MPASSPDLLALRQIGLSPALLQRALASRPSNDARLARVVEVLRDRVLVHDGATPGPAWLWPPLRLRLQLARDALVVGDWTWLTGERDRAWIAARIAPLNRLARRDASGAHQPLVANIDTALLVMGLDGDFNLRRLDRFLVLAHSAGIAPVVVLTKADQCADTPAAVARVQAHLAALADQGGAPPVIALDARSADAPRQLAPWLRCGASLVMLGSSGTGKSTLTGSLLRAAQPDLALPLTQPVREADGRGQHTTTTRTLQASAGGACLIDTPGLRQLWLAADVPALRSAFAEIDERAALCRFRNCRHDGEPGCAVRGHVPPERVLSFQKLLREAARDPQDAHARRAQLATLKQRTREQRARAAALRRDAASG